MNAAALKREEFPDPLESARYLVGLIGDGIQESLSPYLHQEEARHHGLSLYYHLIDLAQYRQGAGGLAQLLESAGRVGFKGLNITYPCKQRVMPLLDDLSDDARAIGAVNTVVIRDGKMTGHNTDWSGFSRGFERALPGASLGRVLLLGAGGAGAAVGHAILKLGAQHLLVADAAPARAQELTANLARRFPGAKIEAATDANAALRAADGLIHATPTGMAKTPGIPIDEGALAHRPWVAEIVYFPIETELLEAARRRGCAISDGGGMAVGQAIGAFELFTGRRADAARMDAHFRRLLDNKAHEAPPAP